MTSMAQGLRLKTEILLFLNTCLFSVRTSIHIRAHTCAIVSLCVRVTSCHGDKALFFVILSLFFHALSVWSHFPLFLNVTIQRQDTNNLPSSLLCYITAFKQAFLSPFHKVWTFFSGNFSFPLRTGQSFLSCDGERVWNYFSKASKKRTEKTAVTHSRQY